MSIEASADPGEMKCARHPKVETRLACGRCETPICPKCMVMTDVGARCPSCAPRRRLPQYEISPLYVLRAVAASAIAGAVIGAAWGLILGGLLGFFALFLGISLGYGVAEPVSWATNRKSGPLLAGVAAAGVLLAFAVRNLIAADSILPSGDLFAYLAVVIGVVVAVNRLRD